MAKKLDEEDLSFFVDIEVGFRVVATLLTFVAVFWWFVFEIMNEGSL